MFCGEMKVDLRAHFLSVHQEEEKIKELSTLGKKERIQAIAALCRQIAALLAKEHEDCGFRWRYERLDV